LQLFLRGNVITLDGEAEAVAAAAVVVRELSTSSSRATRSPRGRSPR
jgi:phosphate starvation-inducible PhoH-like protein